MNEQIATSLYEALSLPAPQRGPGTTPDTIITKTIETVDNDRATALLPGTGLS